jgi:hypothetical protein
MVDAQGSASAYLTRTIVEKFSKSPVVREAVNRKLALLRSELEGPAPTPLERLLAERAALCWFQVNSYEDQFERCRDLNIRQADFHQRKIDAAHRRFLSAVKTLATVRKLALPAIQVNIAKKQVNVASS